MASQIVTLKCIKSSWSSIFFRSYCDLNTKYERSLNSVQLIGRTGNDPQKRGSETNSVTVFSLATNITYKNSDTGNVTQKVDWHRICIFKPGLKDLVYNYLRKGQRVYVSGKISYGEVNDDFGKKVILTSIIAEDVIFFNSAFPQNKI
ncbi:hypothetical protein PGB90_003136 [Kerria lacca]